MYLSCYSGCALLAGTPLCFSGGYFSGSSAQIGCVGDSFVIVLAIPVCFLGSQSCASEAAECGAATAGERRPDTAINCRVEGRNCEIEE